MMREKIWSRAFTGFESLSKAGSLIYPPLPQASEGFSYRRVGALILDILSIWGGITKFGRSANRPVGSVDPTPAAEDLSVPIKNVSLNYKISAKRVLT